MRKRPHDEWSVRTLCVGPIKWWIHGRTSCSSIITPSIKCLNSSCESCCVASAYSSCFKLSCLSKLFGLNAFLPLGLASSSLPVGSSLSSKTRRAAVIGSGEGSASKSGLYEGEEGERTWRAGEESGAALMMSLRGWVAESDWTIVL